MIKTNTPLKFIYLCGTASYKKHELYVFLYDTPYCVLNHKNKHTLTIFH